MLEAVLMAMYVLIISPLLFYVKVPPIAIFIGMCIFMIPGIYAMITGAPFVPTRKKTVNEMVELADIKPGMKVYDLGCGDGRIVFAAASAGATAEGHEFSIPTYILAKLRSLGRRNAKIKYANFWKQSYSDADVIFCFLLTETMQKFFLQIWPQLKPGTKVVSHVFTIKDLKPIKKTERVVVYQK